MLGKTLAFLGKTKRKTSKVMALIKMGINVAIGVVRKAVVIVIICVFVILYLAAMLYIVLDGNIKETDAQLTQTNYKTRAEEIENYENTNDEYPQYLQNDDRWKNDHLNDGTLISDSGSGVCAVAGAISKLTGKQITPQTLMDDLNDTELNSDNVGIIASKAGEYYGYRFILGSDSSLNNLIDKVIDNNEMIVIAQIEDQVLYFTSSGNDKKPIKLVNSRIEKNTTSLKYKSGNVTKQELLDEKNLQIIGYYDGSKISTE